MAGFNDIFAPRTIEGNLSLSRVDIGGWENVLHEFTTDGQYWAELSGSTLTFYSRPNLSGGYDSDDAFAQVQNVNLPHKSAVLEALNSSGITGTCDITTGTGEVRGVISYCDENDVRLYVPFLSTALDSTSQFEGDSRFRRPLMESKRLVDELIRGRLAKMGGLRDGNNRIDVLNCERPDQFRHVQAQFAAAILLRNLGGPSALDYLERADKLENSAYELLNRMPIEIDLNDDGVLEAETHPYNSQLYRGS